MRFATMMGDVPTREDLVRAGVTFVTAPPKPAAGPAPTLAADRALFAVRELAAQQARQDQQQQRRDQLAAVTTPGAAAFAASLKLPGKR